MMINSTVAKFGAQEGNVAEENLSFEEKVGAKLAALRERKGMTQPEAAKGAGVGYRSITRWEAGRQLPSSRNLQKLAAFYSTTPDKILK